MDDKSFKDRFIQRIKEWLQTRFAKGLLTGLFVGILLTTAVFFVLHLLSKEQMIRYYIKKEAITEATDADLDEGKYDGMAGALGDKYAAYYTKDETSANKEKKSGTYEGIGIVISQTEDGAIVVIAVYPGTSSEEAGIEPGDLLLEVNGTSTEGMESSEVAALIGEGDKLVNLKLERDGQTFEVTAERRPVEVPKVSSAMMEEKIGYIRIESFIYTTAEQFDTAVTDLTDEGMEGLIIDLRGNTGGLVDASVDCLDRLLPNGLAVYTLTKDEKRHEYVTTGDDEIGVPVVLLVDARTASAAEIFAGCLRDRLGSPLVGTVTFGKGIVQVTQFLMDGSSFKYTAAHYYTPEGDDINGTGFEPDYPVELDEGEHYATAEDDAQYQKAVEVLKGMM